MSIAAASAGLRQPAHSPFSLYWSTTGPCGCRAERRAGPARRCTRRRRCPLCMGCSWCEARTNVLMPLHLVAALRPFEVELRVVELDVGANEVRDRIGQRRGLAEAYPSTSDDDRSCWRGGAGADVRACVPCRGPTPHPTCATARLRSTISSVVARNRSIQLVRSSFSSRM